MTGTHFAIASINAARRKSAEAVITFAPRKCLMKQLLLDIVTPAPPALENLVAGRNAELILAARNLAAGNFPERILYVWGEAGAGKSHLAQSIAGLAGNDAAMLRPGYIPEVPTETVMVLDHVDALPESDQQALFNLINLLGESKLLVTGPVTPRDLPLRRDLTTRLGSGLVFQMKGLSDDEKQAALLAHAQRRGFTLGEDIAAHLLRHGRRDMRSLIAMLDALDRHSLESGRVITLPLVREALAQNAAGGAA